MHSTSGFAGDILGHVDLLWLAAVSSSTCRSYTTGFQHFLRFLTLYGVVILNGQLPTLHEDLLIQFVAYCHKYLSLKYSTIKLYLAGVRFHYLKDGQANPFTHTDRLQYILRGVKRWQQSLGTRPRYPITYNLLRQMCGLLQAGVFSPFTDIMLTCACQLAYFGFLRCGEFTVRSSTTLQDMLCIEDVSFALDGLSYDLQLRVSKTDPFRRGITIHIFRNGSLCPVMSMQKFIQMRISQGAVGLSPLFVDFDNSVLTRDKFIRHMRHLLSRLGCNDSKYCGHSFRIGAATSAASAGIPDHMIQTLGRWTSSCYVRYIKTSHSDLCAAQKQMCVV